MAQLLSRETVETALNRSVDKFVELDTHLLNADVNERSMSHRIALYLQVELPGYHVDCEFNRDGFDVKRLELESRTTNDEDDVAVTVFPDIIVHRRGSNKENILVVEMKKASAGNLDIDYDVHKLRAFRDQLGYRLSALLVVGKVHDGKVIRDLRWDP